jgi:hypothetical protein
MESGWGEPWRARPGEYPLFGEPKKQYFMNLTLYEKSDEDASYVVQNYKNQG